MRNTLTSNLLSNKKGVALITVVGVTFFMSLMTATLVATHSSNFALMLDSANQKQAYLAASSGLDYAKFRLSQERRLGLIPQDPITKDLGEIKITETDDGKKLIGEFVGSVPARGFEVQVENLLTSDTADKSRGIPAHCIVLRVHGNCGTFQANTETVLVEAPLYDSAAISNGSMDMSGVGNWTIDSNDPLRNWVRSNDDIQAPKFMATQNDATVSGKMQFLPDGGCPLPGVAWSKKDITIGPIQRDVNGKITNAIDGSNKDAAYSKTSGQMAPHATLNYNAYDLKLGDLNRPNKELEVEIPAGTYDLHKTPITYTEKVFTWVPDHHWGGGHWDVQTETKVQHVNDLVYTAPNQSPVHMMQDTASSPMIKSTPPFDANQVWQSGVNWTNGWKYTEISEVKQPANIKPISTETINVAKDFTSPEMTFTFPGVAAPVPLFKATSNLPLHVTGDFTIKSNKETNFTNPITQTVEPPAATPNISFDKPGEATAVAGNFGFIYASQKSLKPTSPTDNPKNPGTVACSISLQGTVDGKGAVAATGDLTLGGSSSVTADVDNKNNSGLVLWSGRNITFDVEDGKTMGFKGLVYGKNDVNLRFAAKKDGSQGKLESLDLEGALVAQSGKIKMGDSKTVKMKYNKDYLKIFTTGLPENTARFAQVSFKLK